MSNRQNARQNQGSYTTRQPYFPFYADDWISGTLGLSMEERGFYIAVLAAMWSRKGAIPIEQLPVAIVADPRTVRRLLDRLIDAGKLSLDASNSVYNSRLLDLINREDVDQSPANLRAISGRSPADLREKSGNIFPEKQAKTTKPRARVRLPYPYPESVREKEPKPARSESVAASGPEIGELNGATATIVAGLAGWLNAHMPDIDTARRMVTKNVGIFGAEAVKRAYADLETDILTNKIVGNPLKAFTAYCANTTKRGTHGTSQQGVDGSPRLSKHERLKRAIAESNRQLGISADP